MRRIAPVFALYFLAPLVAEFLLGDFTVTYLPLLLFLAPMYGGGAIVIREFARRTGRGWPTIVLLALAYGVFEEGITTQSLFDPQYAHAHLLDHGFLPALGIAVPWTLFVLALHTVWSISVPIALVEELAPTRRTAPWLRTPGLVVASVLFVLGSVVTLALSYATDHFLAPWPTLVVVLLVVVTLVVVALRLPRATDMSTAERSAPSPWLGFAVALVAGAAFMLGIDLPTWVSVAVFIVDFAAVTVAVLAWSRRAGWGPRHRLGLAAGALLTYSWHAFTSHPLLGGSPVVTPVSHVVFALAAVALLAVEVRRLDHKPTQVPRQDELAAATAGPVGLQRP